MADAAKPGDARFFTRTGPHSLSDIAAVLGIAAPGDARLITGVAPLQSAGPQDVSFLDNRRYAGLLAGTKAGAVILSTEFAPQVPAGTIALVSPEPYVGWARISTMFHPFPVAAGGIHPAAIVDPTAEIGADCEIGAGAVIGARVKIGRGSIIGPLAYIAEGVEIGVFCRIHAQVTVSHALIGNHVTLYPGARIGQDGFGFAMGKSGFVPVRQLGRVLIGDGAEVGANSTVDRGSAQDTVIGPGVHIDNLVQIAHNVTIGAYSVVAGQAGVAGSTQIGAQVMLAAQSGLAGHLTIGDKARIGAQSGVMHDVAAGEEVLGAPAQNARAFFREVATLRKLARSGRKTDKAGG